MSKTPRNQYADATRGGLLPSPFAATGMPGETKSDTLTDYYWDGSLYTVRTLSLEPGKWEVRANAFINRSGATPNGHLYGGINTVGTLPSNHYMSSAPWYVYPTGNEMSCTPISRVFTLTSTTTVYFVIQTSLAAGSLLVNGYIEAVRLTQG